jgi:8-oxo-dGTP pyrophosphatase MutT (NUDIX family)
MEQPKNRKLPRKKLPTKAFKKFIPWRRIKAAIKEESAGGVVFRRLDSSRIEIMMIADAKGRWTIPKGHIEDGEQASKTAVREIQEETGLQSLRLFEKLGKVDFRYRREDKLILMEMHVFLIEAYGNTDNYRPEANEGITDVQWFPVNKALELIEYDDISKLFLLALKKIRNGKAY